ncbi:MAG: hypothetical protein ACI8RZ_007575 [Myxococcota bacterium]|jgi:hypothetical protein
MLLLTASALARPFAFEPDLSFQQTVLTVLACTPGTEHTWDGAWPINLGPWWDCHGTVTAGPDAAPRSYILDGRCENISYQGTNRLSGTFTRLDGDFGVQSATWRLQSVWEHYMLYTDTDQVITVTQLE